MPKILVTYAHPDAPPSRVNRALRSGVQKLLEGQGLDVRWHDLYHSYPDFHIKIKQEQGMLLAHDILIFQHPLFWYSVPALLKHWFDEVLTEGWAYGRGGEALAGKIWAHRISAGGAERTYSENGQNGHDLPAMLLPLEQTARLCHCEWQSPGITYSSLTLNDEDLEIEIARYASWIKSLALKGKRHA